MSEAGAAEHDGSGVWSTAQAGRWSTEQLPAPVRASFLSNTNLHWRRIYALPDIVYFHLKNPLSGLGGET